MALYPLKRKFKDTEFFPLVKMSIATIWTFFSKFYFQFDTRLNRKSISMTSFSLIKGTWIRIEWQPSVGNLI